MTEQIRGLLGQNPRTWLYQAMVLLAIGVGFPFLDKSGFSISGVIAYLVVGVIATLVMRLGWYSVRELNPPTWLQTALILAIAIRLLVGVGLFSALPSFGYSDSKPHSTGYIYQDAYERDKDAWRFAISDAPLLSAWTDADLSDQYGGLHFTSTFIYRAISIDEHRPLLVVLLSVGFGSLAVIFTWASTRRLFGGVVAKAATWIVVLYPEAILLSASQMREPFLIAALALGLDGYTQIRIDEWKDGLLRILAAFLIALVLSPPFSLVMVGLLALAWIWEGKVKGRQRIWVYGAIGVLGIFGLLLTVRGWSSIPGSPDGNIIELLSWWFSSGAEYQLHLLKEGSGWVQKIFELVPEWSHMPLATMYGLVQPFLPAALMDSSSLTLIRVIVSLRALGWFITLPFLLYAPILIFRKIPKSRLTSYFVLLFWIAVIFVSYRDAGRMWDNPRWRAIFLSIQGIVMAWVWVNVRERGDPWLKRLGVIVGFATLGFIQWEAGRYYQLPRLNLWETLGVIGGFSMLYVVGTYLYDRKRR
jgi:hypothetical protein